MNHVDMAIAIAVYHTPIARNKNMVYSVWEDGEITLEKGGELFGQRTLHCIELGNANKAWPVSLFPIQNHDASHGRIFCAKKKRRNGFPPLYPEHLATIPPLA